MQRPLRSLRALALGATALASAPAFAAEATQAQADSIAAAIRDFAVQMVGPNVTVPPMLVSVKPDGDHYAASVQAAPYKEITARLTDAGAGRWAFDNLHYPTQADFNTTTNGPDGKPTRLSYSVKLAGQDGHGVVDTTMATASSAVVSVRGADALLSNDAGFKSTTHIETGSEQLTLTPTGNNQADLIVAAMVGGLTQSSGAAGTPSASVHLEADKGAVTVAVSGMSRQQAPGVVRALAELGGPKAAGQAGANALHALTLALDGFAASARIEESFDQFHVVTADTTVDMAHAAVSVEYDSSPAGTSSLALNLLVDGFALPPDLVGSMTAFIPERLVLPIALSGINTQQLLKALQDSTAEGRSADAGPPPEVMQLLSSPDTRLSVSLMEVVLGDTKIEARGEGNPSGPAGPAAKGSISASGFDALVDRAKAVPQAAQILPALLFVKGIGRNDGSKIVWDITYGNGQTLVNGVDVAAMAGQR